MIIKRSVVYVSADDSAYNHIVTDDIPLADRRIEAVQ
ncbi:hypothetical protein SJDPG4_08330 [Porphyromonas gingivalis SJD4]|nr:hypothetical protein SJDPG4_08330 [Porphyromonas gingivalis SJD4]